ncbi:copper amine oxidase N-terminal domain-containing protein [Bacillus thuringiensis]|uniref:copper amine oxidase N-terminal domain-containing protein n=1 Tax=Bacillus thuringiensis TaxID=1428 RepID=UPI0021D68363|nr:copper amine oxidase N-terminal domain-containing protein [Bacillus thuringiensis]MCU7667796.1 copper amine oxidase N-terminal domain-containing protein [Bacillus thuringiensis]
MKKTLSSIVAAGLLFSGMATQTVSADVNPLEHKFNPFSQKQKTVSISGKKKMEVYIDDIPFGSEVNPVMKNNRILVAFRPISEYLDADLKWDNKAKKVTVTHKNKKIELTNGKKEGLVNGKKKKLDESVQIINGKVYVPLRFVSESLGTKVNWNAKEKVVTITTQELVSMKYFYSNTKGELGAPITMYQFLTRAEQGVSEGRELIGAEITKNLTDGTYQAFIMHNGVYTAKGEQLNVTSMVYGDTNSTGTILLNEEIADFVINAKTGETKSYREAKQKDFKTVQEAIDYSFKDVLKDLGYIEKLPDNEGNNNYICPDGKEVNDLTTCR